MLETKTIQIRLHGPEKEMAMWIDDMERIYKLRTRSKFYPDRGGHGYGRVYLTVETAIYRAE